MRLITRKLWRAFPELDGYDDATCRDFVRAAWGAGARRAWSWALVVGGTMVVLGSVSPLAYMLLQWMENQSPVMGGRRVLWVVDLLMVSAFAAWIGLGLLAGFWVRDVLIRRRVRVVLTEGGKCRSCGYRLLGLPVSARNNVTCPECGLVTAVDASLGELELDEAGRARFAPRSDRVGSLPPTLAVVVFRWVVRWRRVVLGVVGTAVAVASIVGLYVWHLESLEPGAAGVQWSRAAAKIIGADGVDAGAEEASRTLRAVFATMGEVERTRVESWGPTPEGWDRGAHPWPAVMSDVLNSEDAQVTALLARMMAEYRGARVLGEWAALAEGPLALEPIPRDPDPWNFEWTSGVRGLYRVGVGDLREAAALGDEARFITALRPIVWLIRVEQTRWTWMDRLTSTALLNGLSRELGGAMAASSWSAEFYAQVQRELDRIEEHTWKPVLEAQRAMALEQLEQACSDDGRGDGIVLVGRLADAQAPWRVRAAGRPWFTRWNTYGLFLPGKRELQRLIHPNADAAVQGLEASRVEPAAITTVRSTYPAGSNEELVAELLVPQYDHTAPMANMFRASLGGARLVVAIEQYGAEHGEFPESLDELPAGTPLGEGVKGFPRAAYVYTPLMSLGEYRRERYQLRSNVGTFEFTRMQDLRAPSDTR